MYNLHLLYVTLQSLKVDQTPPGKGGSYYKGLHEASRGHPWLTLALNLRKHRISHQMNHEVLLNSVELSMSIDKIEIGSTSGICLNLPRTLEQDNRCMELWQ